MLYEKQDNRMSLANEDFTTEEHFKNHKQLYSTLAILDCIFCL